MDWAVGLAFPCQQPMLHANGVTEIPKFRISPDYFAKLQSTDTWQDGIERRPAGHHRPAAAGIGDVDLPVAGLGPGLGIAAPIRHHRRRVARRASSWVGHTLRAVVSRPDPDRAVTDRIDLGRATVSRVVELAFRLPDIAVHRRPRPKPGPTNADLLEPHVLGPRRRTVARSSIQTLGHRGRRPDRVGGHRRRQRPGPAAHPARWPPRHDFLGALADAGVQPEARRRRHQHPPAHRPRRMEHPDLVDGSLGADVPERPLPDARGSTTGTSHPTAQVPTRHADRVLRQRVTRRAADGAVLRGSSAQRVAVAAARRGSHARIVGASGWTPACPPCSSAT